ncbi:conserved exported protein of unknown function [Hyphomicrobium sp. 1Nfss2.1]|uniref:glucosaminidase domain-containing protein n=1 Tax=Hyphomicrobium sp. 1Nfss2.1 TaxID=3413936 RepID=UPI003C7C93EA
MVTPLSANGRFASCARHVARTSIAVLAMLVAAHAEAAPPKIRTDAGNTVPRCVTPQRLMAFLKTRNSNLDPRFASIASFYKKHGEAWGVRWDYAFFQMALETNFLTYRRGNGDWGDVNPRQNNFAGLGTTGGGVPGDSYPDVSTGVLAQIQHLVVYSGQRINNPVGARTRLKQDDIIAVMASKNGQTTFGDLARRWAADRHYGASIEWVASSYRQSFCTGPDPVEEARAVPEKPVRQARNNKEKLAKAANLGGPQAAPQAAAEAPVRTIWSAGNAEPGAAVNDGATAPKTAQVQAVKVRTAPMPVRKPEMQVAALDSGPVVAEQMIQTGSEPAPVAELAPAAESSAPMPQAGEAVAETPSEAKAEAKSEPTRVVAFAYAGAMASALPRAQSTTKAEIEGCRVATASYGGKKILLVRSADSEPLQLTLLTVLDGFEKSMLDNFLKAHAPGGASVGEFTSRDAALAKARELCSRAAGGTFGGEASSG